MQHDRIDASLIGSPFTFKISKAFAVLCFYCVGHVVHHDQLGCLLCQEIKLNPDTQQIEKVSFLGTASPNIKEHT